MGMRMTVVAAVATGVLASPCGGVGSAIIRGVGDEAHELGREVVRSEVGSAGDVARRGIEAVVTLSSDECEKLRVEPTVQEEYALGSALAIHWAQRGGGLMLDAGEKKGAPRWKLHAYLNTVGRNLGAQSPRPTLQWTFGVLEDPETFNAVSAPGGYVFVTRRLLEGVDNEGQLAGVLAHEIAHIVLKHSIHQYNSAKVNVCELAAVGNIASPTIARAIRSALDTGGGNLDLDGNVELLGKVAEKTVELFDKGNSQEQEHEADALAVRLMLSAGYDPAEYQKLIAKTAEGGGVFSNHPSKKERLGRISAVLSKVKPGGSDFQELTTEGLRTPPLKPELTAVIRPNVAKDVK